MPTSRDVAQAAGVSQATVSRALNRPESVSQKTRERVQAAVQALGYHPHSGAIAMKTQRTKTIGVVVSELSNPFFQEIFETLSQEFAKAGSRVIVWDSALHERDAIRALQERSVDGVIMSAWDEGAQEMRDILETGLPVVLLNRTAPKGSFDSVTSDNHNGGQLVANYLHQHGKHHLVFIQGNPHTSTSMERLNGFQAGLHALNQPAPTVLNGEFSFEKSFAVTRDFLDQHGAPDAFFCANDYMAFGVLNAIKAAGMSVPEDVWVIGYDNVNQSGWPIFDLTTVRQDSHQMAQLGAQKLLNRIEDPTTAAVKTILPVQLEIRSSSENAPFNHEN